VGSDAACIAQVFLSACVTMDAPKRNSKSQEVESRVAHPLKIAEGGAASVTLMEGWASPPSLMELAMFLVSLAQLVVGVIALAILIRRK